MARDHIDDQRLIIAAGRKIITEINELLAEAESEVRFPLEPVKADELRDGLTSVPPTL